MQFKLRGAEGVTEIIGECLVKVEARNHDDTVRCVMSLYQTESKTQTNYYCHRIDYTDSGDTYYRLERCSNSLEIYQFFGTEPLANYLYGRAGIAVPGMRFTTPTTDQNRA